MIWVKLEARCLGGHFLVTVKKESRGGRVLPTITDGARQQKVDLGDRAGPYGREWSLEEQVEGCGCLEGVEEALQGLSVIWSEYSTQSDLLWSLTTLS